MSTEGIFFIDLHIHATQSRKQSVQKMTIDSLMNVENIVKKAQELGLHTVGIMEHVEPISKRHPWSEALHVKELVDQLKDKVDFKLYSGCEASIIDLKGGLSASITDLKSANFDYVIASVHSPLPSIPKSIDEYHSLVVEMMKNVITHNPYIDIIGHPWRDTPKILKGLGINTPWSFDLIPEKDITELALFAKHAGVVLEISRPCFEMAGYPRFLRIAVAAGGVFSIGSDAHQWDWFNLISQNEIKMLKSVGINPDNLKVW
jgi:histidinol phosphatase-like PHP family hydrolase